MSAEAGAGDGARLNKFGARELIGGYTAALVNAALLFAAAGTLTPLAVTWRGWLYCLLFTVWGVGHTAYLARRNPELLNHRGQRKPDVRSWDMALLLVFGLAWPIGIPVVAGLEIGRWGATMPAWWVIPGALLYVFGLWIFTWATVVNTFFEKTVRIQRDRAQRVIDAGPYARVRHPGYVGTAAWCVAAPMITGSWWCWIPALIAAGSMVIRTALEDRTLRAELAGYDAYAARVRYRLVPGLW